MQVQVPGSKKINELISNFSTAFQTPLWLVKNYNSYEEATKKHEGSNKVTRGFCSLVKK